MRTSKWLLSAALTAGLFGGASTAHALPLISEIFLNPPGGNDTNNGLEYIELMGAPNASLDGYYILILESEESVTNDPGRIDNVFNLSGMTFGSNGYMALAMKDTRYPVLAGANNVMEDADFDILTPAIAATPTVAESKKTLASGGNAYIQRTSTATARGFGGSGNYSSIGHAKNSALADDADIEAGGSTTWLIHVDLLVPGTSAPVPGITAAENIDADANGIIDPFTALNGRAGWTIIDSIGMIGEVGELVDNRLYGAVNFGPGALGLGSTSTGVYVDTGAELFELEYAGRVSDGPGADAWVISNLTDNAASGYTSALRNYGISGNHALLNDPEVYVGSTAQPVNFPYGFDLTTTIGGPNANYSALEVPEPASLALLASGSLLMLARRRRNA